MKSKVTSTYSNGKDKQYKIVYKIAIIARDAKSFEIRGKGEG